MKFIHTADINLDSPLHDLSAYPDAPVEQLRNASREAFRQPIDRAIEEEVAFLIIAGDLYDDWKDHNTAYSSASKWAACIVLAFEYIYFTATMMPKVK